MQPDMVTITSDQMKALSKLMDKAGIEYFKVEPIDNDLVVECYKGPTVAKVRMNEYGRPIK